MPEWLYEEIQRVPSITDAQIAEMRHIEPVLKMPQSVMYRRIKNANTCHPRNVSFLWDPEPIGDEFTFHALNMSDIITQHHSSVFFKPSLAEVYAWIRVYMPENWMSVKYFCIENPRRIGGCSDMACDCKVMGGQMLVTGNRVVCPGGQAGYELVPAGQ